MAADPFALADPGKTALDPFALSTESSSPLATAPEPDPGPFASGVRQATAGMRAAGGGLVRMAGEGFGVRSLADKGQEIADNANADAAAAGADYRTENVNSAGSALDFTKYALGNLMPYALITVALGAGGRALATQNSKTIAATATREFIKNAGTIAGPAAFNVGVEAGGIFNDAKDTGVKNPIARSIVGGVVAGSLDTAFPAYILGRLTGAAKTAAKGFGVRGMLDAAGKEALKSSAIEGSTEGAQTFIERLAAGQPLDGPDAVSDYMNSIGIGAIGGGVAGGPVGAVHARSAPSAQPIETAAPPQASGTTPASNEAVAPGGGAVVPGVTGEVVAPMATNVATDATPLPKILQKTIKNEFPDISAATQLEPATLFGRIEEVKSGVNTLDTRIAALQAEAVSDSRTRGRTKQKIAQDLGAAQRERSASAQRLSNLNALASMPDYAPKSGSIDNGVLVAESQRASPSIVTPGSPDAKVVTPAAPGFTKSADDLVAENKARQARAAALVVPIQNTPRETIKAPDLKAAQDVFLERAGRVAEANAQSLVDSGILAPEAKTSTRTIIYKAVKSALQADNVEAAKDTIRAGVEKAVSRKLLKQDVDGFVDKVFADLAGEQPAVAPAVPVQAAPVPVESAAAPAAPVESAATPVESAAPPAPAVQPAEAKVERPSVLVIGKVGYAPKSAEPIAIRKNSAGGYDLYHGGYQALDFNTAEPVTYPPEMTTAQILQDVKDRSKELFGLKQRFYEDKSGKQFNSLADVEDHVRAAVGHEQAVVADRGRVIVEALGRIIGPRSNVEIVTEPSSLAGRVTLRPEKDTIAVATNQKDVLSTAYHEGFHYLEERVLNGSERSVVNRGLRSDTKLFQQVLQRAREYDFENKTDIAAEIETKPQEAHAYAFEMWKRGELEAQGMLGKVFAKLREFIERIGNAVRGTGFKSVLDVYRAIDAGAYTTREAKYNGEYAFESNAALTDMAQLMADGQLQPTQLMAESSKFFDGIDLPKPTFKQVFGIGRDSIGGSLKRFYLENIASGTFIARDSKGFGNVFGVLTGHKQRKDFLISQGVDDMLSKWDPRRGASQGDIETVGRALFERTEGAFKVGSAEFQALVGPLSQRQRDMLQQANGMIADRLQQEFVADQKTMAGLLGETSAEYAEWLTVRGAKVQALIAEGYMPERRFGDHVVHVTVQVKDKAGEAKPLTLLREQFETEAEARARLAQYTEALGGDPSFAPKYEYKYSARYDGSLSYQQFLDMARRQGIELTQTERERLARAMVASDSVRNNRIFRRSNVPGYSKDIYRVLAEFAVTMSNKIAYSEFSDAIGSAAQGNQVSVSVKEGQPSIAIDRATDLWATDGEFSGHYRSLADQRIDFVMQRDPGGNWSRNARAAASMYFLGGSISAGAVQLSSLPMNTVPYLYQHTGYGNAFAKVLDAFRTTTGNFSELRDIAKLKDEGNYKIDAVDSVPGLRQALIEAAQDGTVLDTEIYHIMGTTRGGMLSKSPRVQKAMNAWMAPFRMAEQVNRYSTFIAAYKVGVENNLTGQDLYKFAQESVYNTQFRYDEANRPGLAHNPVWAILFTFKSYPIFMGEMIATMFRQNPRAGVAMLLSLAVASGINGLPFAEDLMDLVDTISQRLFGSPFNAKRAVRNTLKSASEAITGADLSGLVMNGMVNEFTGMSFASRVGLGNMIPGTRILTADADYKKSVEEILGPVASLVGGAVKGGLDLVKGEPLGQVAREAAPLAVQNMVKAYQQFTTGFASDNAGRKLAETSTWEALAQSVGFSSGKLAAAYDLDRIDKQTQAFYKEMQKDFTQNIVRAVQSGDARKVNEAYQGVVSWNVAHPDMPMALSGPTLRRSIAEAGMTLNERTLKMLPKGLRSQSIAMEVHGR